MRTPVVYYATVLTRPVGQRLLQELCSTPELQLKPAVAKARLEKLLLGIERLKSVVLVIDEVGNFLPMQLDTSFMWHVLKVDLLLTKDNGILYEIFSWAQRADSAAVLIGVANALDLTGKTAVFTLVPLIEA